MKKRNHERIIETYMATSRLLSLIGVVEGRPRVDEVDLGENTTIKQMKNSKKYII